jgi:hypothetical protein
MHYGAKFSDFEEAQTEYLKIMKEKARREAEAKEEHERYTIEQNKPYNKFVMLWNYRHVYQKELNEYCETYDLTELENFADELRNGDRRHAFIKRDDVQALSYLREQINARQPKDPQMQKLREVQQARKELAETKAEEKKTQEKIEKLQATADELKQKLVKSNDNPNPDYSR